MHTPVLDIWYMMMSFKYGDFAAHIRYCDLFPATFAYKITFLRPQPSHNSQYTMLSIPSQSTLTLFPTCFRSLHFFSLYFAVKGDLYLFFLSLVVAFILHARRKVVNAQHSYVLTNSQRQKYKPSPVCVCVCMRERESTNHCSFSLLQWGEWECVDSEGSDPDRHAA